MNVVVFVLALTAQQPQDTIVLKPVVVTATRIPVAADAIASAITVLRGADLQARGIRTVADALRTVPGAAVVETGSLGGQTALFMRGGESDYVKVLLDGVPLNQAGGGIDLANLTTDNVDRIEIVRGPVSVLYGSDAMTGVVQIFTKTGQGPSHVGMDLHAGTYGTTDGAVDVAGSTQMLHYSARLSRIASDGLYSYNNQYRNAVASARVAVTPDARSDVSVTYRYGDALYHFPTNGQGAPVDSNQRSGERGPTISVAANRSLSRGLDLRLLATLREARLTFNDEPDSPGEDGTFWSHDYVRRASTGAMITWRAREAVSLTGGIEYEDERQRGTSEFSASFGTFPDSIAVQRFTTGYFTQGLLRTGPLSLTLGARLDDNSQFGTHSTYRAGAVYALRDGTRLRTSAGTGFKEPTFFENFAHGFVQGNPNLDPERSLSWELGVEHGAVTVTYFDQRFRDLIEFTFSPPPGQPNYFNVAGARANGIEANASTAIVRRVVVSARYTFLHTRVEKGGLDGGPDGLFVAGRSLIRRPAHTLAPEIAVTLTERARVTLGARWVGKRDDLDFRRPPGQERVTLPPYARVNLTAEYDLRRVVLSGRLDNAFNDQSQEIPGFRPRGRTIMLGGRVAFGR